LILLLIFTAYLGNSIIKRRPHIYLLFHNAMSKLTTLLLVFITLYLNSSTTYATTQPLLLIDPAATQLASPYVYVLEDSDHSLSLKQIVSPTYDQQFVPNTQKTPNFGRTTSVYWLRFTLKNQSHVKWYLLMDIFLGEELDLYIVPHQVETDKKELQAVTRPFAQRVTSHYRALWSLDLPHDTLFTVYIRASNGGKILKLPIEFVPADTMLEQTIDAYRLYTFLYAAMLILALYNLFLFFSFREISYLSLVGVILSTAATSFIGNPVFESLHFLSRTGGYFYTFPFLMVVISYSFFSKQVLQTQQQAPKLEIIYRLYIGSAILLIPIAGLIPSIVVIPLVMIASLLLLTFLFSIFLMVTKGNVIAKNLAVAALVAVSGALPELTSTLFNVHFWINYKGLLLIGAMVSLILLSFIQTERTRLLRQKMEQTEAISEAKDSFFASMSHELRTPMNTVLGVSTLLKLSVLNEKQHTYLEKLELSARHLLELINDILDTAKIKNKRFQLAKQSFQLKAVLNKVQNLLEEQATQKGLKLIIAVKDKASLDHSLLGDSTRLSQILINLVNNGIKFTEHGEVRLTIQQTQKTPQTLGLLFTISDTGIGIPEQQQVALFDPFTQVEQDTTHFHQGTGLGLTISKGLVEVMGGELELESTLNEGSRFFFTLTFALDNNANPVETVPTTSNENALSTLILPKKLNILLVDDNEMNRFIGREMIQAMQGKVTLAPDGKSSIVQLQQHHFDVVLMDISMPDMDGFEVTQWIRTQGQNPNVTIIALTAHATATIRQQCKAAGMDGYLSKPFEYEDLYNSMLQFLI